ncbi:hypothetical protein [Bradyrhizobium cenepequi]
MSRLYPLSPLALVLKDIERAIDARLYYPALLAALTVPEICSALTLEKAVFVRQKHYAAFIDRYTTPSEIGSNGVDIYRLRGGVVHRASMAGHPDFGATHVIFTIPETGAGMHALSIRAGDKTAAMFDLVTFCRAMIKAAYLWYEEHHSDPKVQENMRHLIRYCPQGLSPFVGGAPVVGCGDE